MSIVFTDEVEALPASAPVNKLHIIDVDHFIETLEEGARAPKLWDVVATVLYKISTETLRHFLDTNTRSFKLTHDPNSPSSSKLIIWRRGHELMVGHFTPEELDGDLIYLWDNLIRCEVDGNGAWKVVAASFGLISDRNMDHVWNGLLIDPGMFIVIKAQDDRQKQELARILGCGMLTNPLWEQDRNQWEMEVKLKDEDKGKDKGKDKGTTESANSSET